MAVIKLTNTAVEKLQPAGIRKEYRDEKIKGLLVRGICVVEVFDLVDDVKSM